MIIVDNNSIMVSDKKVKSVPLIKGEVWSIGSLVYVVVKDYDHFRPLALKGKGNMFMEMNSAQGFFDSHYDGAVRLASSLEEYYRTETLPGGE